MYPLFKKVFNSTVTTVVNATAESLNHVDALVNPTLPTWRTVTWRDGFTSANAKALGWNALDMAVSVGASAFNAALSSSANWGLTLGIVWAGQAAKQIAQVLQLPPWLAGTIHEVTLFTGFVKIAYMPAGVYVQNKIIAMHLAMNSQQLVRFGFDEGLANRTMGLLTDCCAVVNKQIAVALATAPIVERFPNYTQTLQAQYDKQEATVVLNQTIAYHLTDTQFFWHGDPIGNITKEIIYAMTPVGLQPTSQTVSFRVNDALYQQKIDFANNSQTVTTETPFNQPTLDLQLAVPTLLTHLSNGWEFFLERLSLPNIFVSAQNVAADANPGFRLRNDIDLNAQGKDGETQLHIYAKGKSHGNRIGDDAFEAFITPANINMQDANGRTALINAIGAEDYAKVKILLQHKPDVGLRDTTGGMALFYSFNPPWNSNNKAIFELLLEYISIQPNKYDLINAKNKEGSTALMVVAFSGYYDAAKSLVDHGADCNAVDNKGYTMLFYMERESDIKILELCLKPNSNIPRTIADITTDRPIVKAMLNKWYKIFAALLDHQKNYYDVNVKRAECLSILEGALNLKDSKAAIMVVDHCPELLNKLLPKFEGAIYFPVIYAMVQGDLSFVQHVFKNHFARIQNQINDIFLAFFEPESAQGGVEFLQRERQKIMDYIIEFFQQNNIKLNAGNLPRFYTFISMDRPDIAKGLLSIGDESFHSALNNDLALTPSAKAEEGRKKKNTGRILVNDHGVNNFDENGMNALMRACEKGDHAEVVKLKNLGASVLLRNTQNDSALDYAVTSGNRDTVDEVFVQSGQLDHENSEGYTPVELALLKRHYDIFEYFFNHQFYESNIISRNERLLLLARSEGEEKVADILVKKNPDLKKSDDALPKGKYALKMAYAIYTRKIERVKEICEKNFADLEEEGEIKKVIIFLTGAISKEQEHEAQEHIIALSELLEYFTAFLRKNEYRDLFTQDEFNFEKLFNFIFFNKMSFLRSFVRVCDKSFYSLRKDVEIGSHTFHNINIFELAVLTNNVEACKIFKENGADLAQRNSAGDTLLHVAMIAPEECTEVVSFLLENGVDVNAVNNYGQTALMVARDVKNSDRADASLLKSRGGITHRRFGQSEYLQLVFMVVVSILGTGFLFCCHYNLRRRLSNNNQPLRSETPTALPAQADSITEDTSVPPTTNSAASASNTSLRLRANRQQQPEYASANPNNSAIVEQATEEKLADQKALVGQEEKRRCDEYDRLKQKIVRLEEILAGCKEMICNIAEIHKNFIDFINNRYQGLLEIELKFKDFHLKKELTGRRRACAEAMATSSVGEFEERMQKISAELVKASQFVDMPTQELKKNEEWKAVCTLLDTQAKPLLDEITKYYKKIAENFQEVKETEDAIYAANAAPRKKLPAGSNKPRSIHIRSSASTSTSSASASSSFNSNISTGSESHDGQDENDEKPTPPPKRINKWTNLNPTSSSVPNKPPSASKPTSTPAQPAKTALVATRVPYKIGRAVRRNYIFEYLRRIALILASHKSDVTKNTADNTRENTKRTICALQHLLARLNLALLRYERTSETAERAEERTATSHAIHQILRDDDAIITTAQQTVKTVYVKLLTESSPTEEKTAILLAGEIESLLGKLPQRELDEQRSQLIIERIFQPSTNVQGLLNDYYTKLTSTNRVSDDKEVEDESYALHVRNELIPVINRLFCLGIKELKAKSVSTSASFSQDTAVDPRKLFLFPTENLLDLPAAVALFSMIGERTYKEKDKTIKGKEKAMKEFIVKCQQLKGMEYHEVSAAIDIKISARIPDEIIKDSYLLIESSGRKESYRYRLVRFFHINKRGELCEVAIDDMDGLREDLEELIRLKQASHLEKKKLELLEKHRIAIHESIVREMVRDLCVMAYEINPNKCNPDDVDKIFQTKKPSRVSSVSTSSTNSSSVSSASSSAMHGVSVWGDDEPELDEEEPTEEFPELASTQPLPGSGSSGMARRLSASMSILSPPSTDTSTSSVKSSGPSSTSSSVSSNISRNSF